MKKVFSILLLVLLFSCENKSEPTIPYSVAKQDLSGDQATYNIIINDSTRNAKDMIAIAHKLKSAIDWDKQLVCFFYLKGSSMVNPWASVSYSPECPACANEKDSAGNDVEYLFFGIH